MVSEEVAEFLAAVPTVQEESITEYLLWRWAKADPHLRYLHATAFTKHRERSTGADFELELWLLGAASSLPLLFQAKILKEPFDSYVRRLNYPNNSGRQLKSLVSYANANRRIPAYALYGTPSGGPGTQCPSPVFDHGAVFVADAHDIAAIAGGALGRRVSKDIILSQSNPLHCFFCCPLSTAAWPVGSYLRSYFPAASNAMSPAAGDVVLPSYIRALLERTDTFLDPGDFDDVSQHLNRIRYVAVYDGRG